MFNVASELFQEEKCREKLICEVYHREFISDNPDFDYLAKFLELFPVVQRAKSASYYSKSKGEGCNNPYTGCAAINRVFDGTEGITPFKITV